RSYAFRPQRHQQRTPRPLRRTDSRRRPDRIMNTGHRRQCSVCGRELPGAMGFCPVCMLRAAADVDSEPGPSSLEDTVEPSFEPGTARLENYELLRGKKGSRLLW